MMKNNKGFTLMELLISITIFATLVVTSYIPYSYHQSKSKVKIWSKTISQVITESRALSISGLERFSENSSWTDELRNVSVWAFFKKWEGDISILSYPHDINDANLRAFPYEDYDISDEKTLRMPIKVEVSEVNWKESWVDKTSENILVIFKAIKGIPQFYIEDTAWVLTEVTPDNDLEIIIWINSKNTWVMSAKITFNKNTGLIDY